MFGTGPAEAHSLFTTCWSTAMLIIANVKYTLSEVVQMIKTNPDTPWRSSYLNYLLKIAGSGSTTFLTFNDLLMRLAGYVMGESRLEGIQLANHRGQGPGQLSAMVLDPVDRNAVRQEDRAAINSLMTTGGTGGGITNESTHQTDPETGGPKGIGVSVKEYYVNGDAGRRAVKRSQNNKVTYYYSSSHAFNHYRYQRLT
jgi:hypothetical protein